MAQWLSISLLMALAALVQTSVGFGFGLVAISAMVVLGVDPPRAILIGGLGSLAMTTTGTWHLRREIGWRTLLPMLPVSWAWVPVGVLTLGWLHHTDPARIKQAIGAMVLLALVTQWTLRVQPRERVPTGWGVLALATGGFLTGFVGMGGPPVVLWTLSHRWSAHRLRGSLMAVFAFWAPFSLTLVALRFPELGPGALRDAALALPAMALGAVAGLWLGHHTPLPLLRRAAVTLLAVIGAAALLEPWLH